MRKGIVWALIAAVALCAAALLFFRGKPAAAGDTVVVTVDGREYARVPVGQRQLITVRQDNGAENVVEITARGAVMRSSTCAIHSFVAKGTGVTLPMPPVFRPVSPSPMRV